MGDLAGGPKIAKRFVSAGFASGGVFGPPSLVPKKWPSKVSKKVSCQTKRCKIILLEPCFGGPFLAHRSSGWGLLRCGARFGPLYNAPKRPFSDLLVRSQNRRFPLFSMRSPCGAVRFRAEIPILAAVSRGCSRKFCYTWPGLSSSPMSPLESAEISVFGLGGRLPYDLPKLCRKRMAGRS